MSRKTNGAIRHHHETATMYSYKSRDMACFNKDKRERETLEEFLARGGVVTKAKYKKPPMWKKTFNGFSKFDKKVGRYK